MFSKRIKTIASLVDKDSVVVDVGTDHGYLPIYLIKNNIVKKAYACDVSPGALSQAKKNIDKENLPIETILSDGLDEINFSFDVLVITGMGFYTIEKIFKNKTLPKTIILQSNSDHFLMRKFMMNIGYKIDTEITLKDKKIFYVIIKYVKGIDKLSKIELMFGKSNNCEYFSYLIEKNQKIIKNVPIMKKIEIKKNIKVLNNLLKKNRT